MALVTVSYLIALTLIALFSIAGYFMLQSVIASEKNSSTVINVSGRQRKLSQSIAFYCLKLTTLTNETDRQLCRDNLRQSIDLMQRSHSALTALTGDFGLPKAMSPAVHKIYFEPPENLDIKVQTYLAQARRVLNADKANLNLQNPAIQVVTAQGPQQLVNLLDAAVHQYELDSQQQIKNIEHMELGFLLLTLLLLACEAGLIFFPMSRKIQKQMQDLIDSQRELSAVFDTVGDALLTLNSEHKITTANSQVHSIWGSDNSELIGQPLDALVKNSTEQISLTGPHMLGRYMESEALLKNGETVPLELIVTKTDLSDRVLYTVSLRDITDRKNAEKKISEFYSIVAHELRSPLNSIHGSLRILQGGLAGEINEKAMKYINIGIEDSDRLIRLINDYLDLKKIATGNFELNKSSLALYEIASTAIASMSSTAAHADVTLNLAGDADLRVDCDRDRIIQVFTNLISNAIKYAPAGTAISIAITASKGTRMVRCSVRDYGPGIAMADIPKLFGMFQQLSSARAGGKKGTGLGLAISKAIIEEHEGNIGVDSSINEGSTFWFEMPLSKDVRPDPIPNHS